MQNRTAILPGFSAQVFSFGFVGGVAGIADYAVMIALRELLHADPVLAAAIGYITGSTVSYTLNRLLTFRSSRSHRQALWRFAVVNIAGFALTTLLMAVAIRMLGINYLLSRLVTTGIIFSMNFVSYRFWTFRDGRNNRFAGQEGFLG